MNISTHKTFQINVMLILIHSRLQDQTQRVQPDDKEGEDPLPHLPEGNIVQLRQHLWARLLQAQTGGQDVVPEGYKVMTVSSCKM